MINTDSIAYPTAIPDVYKAFLDVHKVITDLGIDPQLEHLVRLLASQINRCGYCVEMHTDEARRDGETSERLDRVIVWDQVECFTEAEQAALDWTDALTRLNPASDYTGLRANLRNHFSDEQIGLLTAAIGMINLWNRVNISNH